MKEISEVTHGRGHKAYWVGVHCLSAAGKSTRKVKKANQMSTKWCPI